MNLGSDHRAVWVAIKIGKCKPCYAKKYGSMKGWQPTTDNDNQPNSYQALLHDQLHNRSVTTLADLEPMIYNAAAKTQLNKKMRATKKKVNISNSVTDTKTSYVNFII